MFSIRQSNLNDINFVYATWLRSYKDFSPISKYIERQSFFPSYQRILDKLLSRDQIKVMIACDENDSELIFGYVAFEPGIVHFIYVKEPFRKMGIAKKLCSHIPDFNQCKASHLTYYLLDLWTAKKTNIQFNPFLIEVI